MFLVVFLVLVAFVVLIFQEDDNEPNCHLLVDMSIEDDMKPTMHVFIFFFGSTKVNIELGLLLFQAFCCCCFREDDDEIVEMSSSTRADTHDVPQ
jgi:hypothetical protein